MISFGFFLDWQLGIALLWLVYRAALEHRVPLVAARAYLLSVVPLAAGVAALKLPILSPVVLVVEPMLDMGAAVEPSAAAVATSSVDWLAWGYAAVAAGVLCAAVWGGVRWAVRWRSGTECGGVRFCAQPHAAASSLFGRIAVSNACFRSDALEAILAHERAHVRLGHSWDMLAVSLLRAALWVNPAVWLLGRDLVRVHEAQADAAVLDAGYSPERYIKTLLDAQIGALGDPNVAVAPIHYFSFRSTKNRIAMMTRFIPSRRSMWRLMAALPVVGVMAVMFSFTRPVVLVEKEAQEAQATAPEPSKLVLEYEDGAVVELSVSAPAPKAEAALSDSANFALVVKHSNQNPPTNELPVFDAETMPKFQGGDLGKFRNWVQSSIAYPADAKAKGIQGRVSLTFVIEKDGTLTGVQVLRGVEGLNDAAVKAVASSPKWTPGTTHGEPVRIRYNMPVDFILGKEAKKEYVAVVSYGAKAADAEVEAEVMPQFEGGDLNKFKNWLQQRVEYPATEAEKGVQGRVVVSFVVEKDGSVSEQKIVRGVSEKIDAETLRVLGLAPKWTPGTTKGEPVRIRYNMPVDFILQ